MNRLNSEGHDESQYLPKKWFNPKTEKEESYPVVNPFRAQHGKVRLEGEEIKALTWLPDILHDTYGEDGKELLSRDYLQICETIFRIVMSARNALGISDLRSFLGAEQLNQHLSARDPFFALLSKLLPYQSNMVLWIVCDEYNRGNIDLARKLIETIRNSLDLAKKVIDDCKGKD